MALRLLLFGSTLLKGSPRKLYAMIIMINIRVSTTLCLCLIFATNTSGGPVSLFVFPHACCELGDLGMVPRHRPCLACFLLVLKRATP
jgi:hypothetical protein